MTLPGATLFPQALMPLYIFEPRYRQMLRDSLDSHRLFAVAGLDVSRMGTAFEPPYRIATVGVVRACHGNQDGTSNLLLQGLSRVEVTETLGEAPYRRIRVRPLSSEPGAGEEENASMHARLSRLLRSRHRLGSGQAEFVQFLTTIDDPEIFVDLAAFSVCTDNALKQRVLETLDVHERYKLMTRWARAEVEALRLGKRLQGDLGEDQISSN